MMRRYVSTDIPEIREFFKEDPHLLIRLEAGLQAQLMTHLGFPIWLVVLLAALIAGAAISRLRRGRGREETA